MAPLGPNDEGYIARGSAPDDVPAMLRVIEAAFESWPPVEIDCTPLEHLEWKMSSPGVTPDLHTVVVDADGEIVAAKVRWASRAMLMGSEEITDHGVDYAVHPDHQGHGLGRMIVDREAADQIHLGVIGFDLVYTHAAVVRVHSGVPMVHRPMRNWSRPVSVRSAVKQGLRRGPRALARALTRPDAPVVEGVSIEVIESFDERADALSAATMSGFAFARVRDAQYLNWRHADRRSGVRTILVATEGDSLLAWAVLRPHEGTMRLADLLVHPDRADAGVALLEECARRAHDSGASALVAWLPDPHPTDPVLERAGFVVIGEPFTCRFWASTYREVPFEVVKPLEDPDALLHITMGDFDFA